MIISSAELATYSILLISQCRLSLTHRSVHKLFTIHVHHSKHKFYIYMLCTSSMQQLSLMNTRDSCILHVSILKSERILPMQPHSIYMSLDFYSPTFLINLPTRQLYKQHITLTIEALLHQ